MTDYDSLSVHDLVDELFSAGNWGNDELISALESALRKAVVREASVQVFHIKTKETARSKYGVWNECEVNDVKQDRVSALRHLPDGDYALVPIPKEVQT
jgi:hypothetical protein